jgi:hypothetical protein
MLRTNNRDSHCHGQISPNVYRGRHKERAPSEIYIQQYWEVQAAEDLKCNYVPTAFDRPIYTERPAAEVYFQCESLQL